MASDGRRFKAKKRRRKAQKQLWRRLMRYARDQPGVLHLQAGKFEPATQTCLCCGRRHRLRPVWVYGTGSVAD